MFGTIAFISGDAGISETERSIIDYRYGRKVLIVLGNTEKASQIASSMESGTAARTTVCVLKDPEDPVLLKRIAEMMERIRPVRIVITYAPPVVAARLTALANARKDIVLVADWPRFLELELESRVNTHVSDPPIDPDPPMGPVYIDGTVVRREHRGADGGRRVPAGRRPRADEARLGEAAQGRDR